VWKDGNKSEDKDPHFVVGIFLVGFAIVSITVSIIYIDDALKAKLAPKVFIIEYTAKLIKDAK
jgi:hypothetical protein